MLKTAIQRHIEYEKLKAKKLCLHCSSPVTTTVNCEVCRKKIATKEKVRRDKIREAVYAAYGNKCSCPPCGETRWQFLTLDHIDGKGEHHRRRLSNNKRSSGIELTKWAFENNFPSILRLHCWNCNNGRERNNKVCPHLTEIQNRLPGNI